MERVTKNLSGFNTTNAFLNRVIEIHEEFFPDLDSNRMDLIRIRKKRYWSFNLYI